jgi:hypothetical protein
MTFKKIICVFLIGVSLKTYSQLEQTAHYGFNVGFVSAFGTHFRKIGVVVQGYYTYEFAQVNASVRLYDNFKNLGPKGEYVEINAALGLCIGYGKKNTETNQFVSSIGNQTGYNNSIAYSYNVWYNKLKTSQVTGIIALQFNHFSIISENDLLAKPVLDRFRTGALLIQYQDKYIQYAINATLWTGQLGRIVTNDTLFPYKGYINTEGGVYTNCSHGLLSAQIKISNEYGQYLQTNAGIDAEQVRNVLQNKAVHTVFSNNYHIPMIDTSGNQYLYKKGQAIKKSRLYLNAFTNANIFY